MAPQSLPTERHYQPDEQIIAQGEPAMEAFLIMAGEADVRFEKDGTEKTIATLKEGDIFGEAALFKGSDYGASVYAATSVTVQPIPPSILDEKISKCDPMIRALIRMMMIRLRQTNKELSALK